MTARHGRYNKATKLLEQEGPKCHQPRFRIMANLGSAHAQRATRRSQLIGIVRPMRIILKLHRRLSIRPAASGQRNHEEAVNIAHRGLCFTTRRTARSPSSSNAALRIPFLQTQIPQRFRTSRFLLMPKHDCRRKQGYRQLIREAIRRDPQNVLSYAGYLRFREVMRQRSEPRRGGLRGQDIELLTAAQALHCRLERLKDKLSRARPRPRSSTRHIRVSLA